MEWTVVRWWAWAQGGHRVTHTLQDMHLLLRAVASLWEPTDQRSLVRTPERCHVPRTPPSPCSSSPVPACTVGAATLPCALSPLMPNPAPRPCMAPINAGRDVSNGTYRIDLVRGAFVSAARKLEALARGRRITDTSLNYLQVCLQCVGLVGKRSESGLETKVRRK